MISALMYPYLNWESIRLYLDDGGSGSARVGIFKIKLKGVNILKLHIICR